MGDEGNEQTFGFLNQTVLRLPKAAAGVRIEAQSRRRAAYPNARPPKQMELWPQPKPLKADLLAADNDNDPDHLKVFADEDAAEAWFKVNDPEGVAFGYSIIEEPNDRSLPA